MYIITSLFTSNTRIPIILSKTNTPYLLPLLFTITNLKGKSNSTIANYIRVICSIYKYFDKLNINIEEQIIQNNFNQIILKLENFLINKINPNDRKKIDIISNFLSWCSYRYSIDSGEILKIKSILKFNLNSEVYSKRGQFRSLTIHEIEIVRDIINIKSTKNPFKKENKLRNWIIIEILLQSGLRIGELLKLKVNDFIRIEENYFIKISNHKNDLEDSRIIKPSNKNVYSYRTIAISVNLYQIIQIFIKGERRNSKKLRHSYLFVSELGKPLSIRATQSIFQLTYKSIIEHYSIQNFEFSAHILRHTFADNFLRFLIDELKLDMERAKDELRVICGWNISSNMPIRYASRYISSKSNEHNMTRLRTAYK